MRTGPRVDALIEHLVGDPGPATPWKTAFTSSWRALSWHELTHGSAAGCSWVTGGGALALVTRGGGRAARAGDHRGSATAPCLPSDRSTGTTDRAGWHTARGMMGME